MRSCDVAPALAAAMQTMPPTHSAIGWYASDVHPMPMKIRHVAMSVAIVMPEIGFGGADDAHDARGHRHEEEAEDDDQHAQQQPPEKVPGMKGRKAMISTRTALRRP